VQYGYAHVTRLGNLEFRSGLEGPEGGADGVAERILHWIGHTAEVEDGKTRLTRTTITRRYLPSGAVLVREYLPFALVDEIAAPGLTRVYG
jgi:hypothetical protein